MITTASGPLPIRAGNIVVRRLNYMVVWVVCVIYCASLNHHRIGSRAGRGRDRLGTSVPIRSRCS